MMMPHIAKNISESICKMLIGMEATDASLPVPRKHAIALFSMRNMKKHPYASLF